MRSSCKDCLKTRKRPKFDCPESFPPIPRSTFSTGMKENVHPPETSSARPPTFISRPSPPGFVLFSSPWKEGRRGRRRRRRTKQIPTAGDELSERRRGTRNERVSPRYLRDRGRGGRAFSRRSFPGPVTISPEFRSSNSEERRVCQELAKNARSRKTEP